MESTQFVKRRNRQTNSYFIAATMAGPKALTNNATATTANKKINAKANIFTPRLPNLNPSATAPGRLAIVFAAGAAPLDQMPPAPPAAPAPVTSPWQNCISDIIFICRSGSYNHVHSSLAEYEYK